MITRTAIKRLQKGRSKKFSKHFFTGYNQVKRATEELYQTQYPHFQRPFLNKYFNEWKDLGFFTQSKRKIPFPIKNKQGKDTNKRYRAFGYMLNFEPIFQFCKERNNELSKAEKEILYNLLSSIKIRKLILQEYPNEDIITAVLKFYTKNCINAQIFYYIDRDNKDFMSSKEIHTLRLKELNISNNYLSQYSGDRYGKRKYSKEKSIRKKITEEIKHPLLLNNYNVQLRTNRILVKSLDKKIMASLGIYPSN